MPSPEHFNVVDYLQRMERLIGELSNRINALDQVTLNPNRPRHDKSGNSTINRLALETTSRVLAGFVDDSLPFYGWYKVTLDGKNASLVCSCLSEVGTQGSGVQKVGTIRPGSRVFVIYGLGETTGTIIGVDNGYSVENEKSIRDFISQASTNTPISEQVTTARFNPNFIPPAKLSYGSPVDETCLGEWGRMTETGSSVFLDPFMAFLRSDENCGFWAFWHDQLARMHGHNLQIRSATTSMDFFDDESELSSIIGHSPYLWESLGGLVKGIELFKQRTQEAVLKNSTEFSLIDLKELTQTPFHRLVEYAGFLGQGFKKQLRLPPPGKQIFSMDSPTNVPAVWEEHLALDGNYHMVSSQGIFLAHVPVFNSPVQFKRPEDGTGDRSPGYVPTGSQSDGIASGLSGDFPDGTGAALLADDELAYGMKWRSSHPFYKHTNDWKLFDDPEKESAVAISNLSSNHYLPRPDAKEKDVDHRFSANYHPSLSFISILRDGTVVIAGPGGEEIRMGGGSIEISCPGDIQLRPGRNLVALTGKDTVVRARKSVEISASENDVRLKAEKNMQLLAGNSKTGGLLLESRGEGDTQDFGQIGTDTVSNGVIIKSANQAAVFAGEVYIKSGAGTVGNGKMTFEASNSITTSCQAINNYVSSYISDNFGPGDQLIATNQYTAYNTYISGGLYVTGRGDFLGGGVFQSSVQINNGHIATTAGTQYVGEIDQKGKDILNQYADDISNLGAGLKEEKIQNFSNHFADGVYKGIGVAEGAGFSFRTTKQYETEGFMLFESRWAQRARASGLTAYKWKEKPVVTNSNETYPYPGRDAWLGTSYRKLNSKLYTAQESNGFMAKKPGEEYASATIEEESPESPNGNYPVIQ